MASDPDNALRDICDLDRLVREHGPVTFAFDEDSFTIQVGDGFRGAAGGLPIDSIGLAIEMASMGIRSAEMFESGMSRAEVEAAMADGD